MFQRRSSSSGLRKAEVDVCHSLFPTKSIYLSTPLCSSHCVHVKSAVSWCSKVFCLQVNVRVIVTFSSTEQQNLQSPEDQNFLSRLPQIDGWNLCASITSSSIHPVFLQDNLHESPLSLAPNMNYVLFFFFTQEMWKLKIDFPIPSSTE